MSASLSPFADIVLFLSKAHLKTTTDDADYV